MGRKGELGLKVLHSLISIRSNRRFCNWRTNSYGLGGQHTKWIMSRSAIFKMADRSTINLYASGGPSAIYEIIWVPVHVRITSLVSKFHQWKPLWLVPPSSIHRMTGLGFDLMWTMKSSCRPHYCAFLTFSVFFLGDQRLSFIHHGRGLMNAYKLCSWALKDMELHIRCHSCVIIYFSSPSPSTITRPQIRSSPVINVKHCNASLKVPTASSLATDHYNCTMMPWCDIETTFLTIPGSNSLWTAIQVDWSGGLLNELWGV